MLRLSKKTEYAILAMQYIARSAERPVSAKEISDNLNISFEFLSKTLQTLIKSSLIVSLQGKSGGYLLNRNASEISIADIINALDEKSNVVECSSSEMNDGTCGRQDECTIKNPMSEIQNKINNILYETTLAEFGTIYR